MKPHQASSIQQYIHSLFVCYYVTIITCTVVSHFVHWRLASWNHKSKITPVCINPIYSWTLITRTPITRNPTNSKWCFLSTTRSRFVNRFSTKLMLKWDLALSILKRSYFIVLLFSCFCFVLFRRFYAFTLLDILQKTMHKHKTTLIKCFWSFCSKPL